MLARDLALLYQVETKILNCAVKRNLQRFSTDFVFRLTEKVTNCDLKQLIHCQELIYFEGR